MIFIVMYYTLYNDVYNYFFRKNGGCMCDAGGQGHRLRLNKIRINRIVESL